MSLRKGYRQPRIIGATVGNCSTKKNLDPVGGYKFQDWWYKKAAIFQKATPPPQQSEKRLILCCLRTTNYWNRTCTEVIKLVITILIGL